ncbi:hypothetical protein OIU76_007843 [Salix suchowensis]|nr:hypothetical protein OIU76_007843 [Salix suchowensis]
MGSVARSLRITRRVCDDLEDKESAVVVSPDRLQLAEKESGFVEWVAVRVAEEKAVIFCRREEVKASKGCGEGECGGGECRSSSGVFGLEEKESGLEERVAVTVAEEKGFLRKRRR